MSPRIHPSAVVDPRASVAPDVEIGPYCVVGPGVAIGAGCRLLPRVTIQGPAEIGPRNVFHPNAVLGGDPQDLQGPAPDGRVVVGEGNVFRENATVHRPKMKGGVTRIGDRNRFLTGSHVGHDGVVGNGAVLCSFAVLGGHTTVEDEAWIEGQGGTHQFVTLGRRSWTKSHIPVTEDVPPFMWVDGNHFEVRGVHPKHRTDALERAFRTIWGSGLPRPEAFAALEGEASPEVRELLAFLRRSAAGRRGRAGEAARG
jgi:UDP-N-acetylglucosamine acyltransferase